MSYHLEGKTAIVSGGANGIGRAIVERLVQDGARVVIGDIDRPAGEALAAQLGERAIFARLDVTSETEWAETVSAAEAFGGTVDILVNNAGITGRTVVSWETTLDDWNQVISIDLTGVFLGCRAVLPGMVARGYGRIVNMASVAGKVGNPNAIAYTSAKAGVIGMTKAIAKDVMTKGVLVNAIAPAAIETEILEGISAEHKAYVINRIPMGRAGTVAEVAALTAFLCSDEMSFSNGATFDISGGLAQF